jgi:hypothetical protein
MSSNASNNFSPRPSNFSVAKSTATAEKGLANNEGRSFSERKIFILRTLVSVSLLSTFVVCGYGSYSILDESEGTLQDSQFGSISKHVKRGAANSIDKKVEALRALAEIFSHECKTADEWPECSIPRDTFDAMTEPLIDIAKTRAIALAPIITSEQVAPFEAYAKNLYNGTTYGYHSFGFGISAVKNGSRVHDTQGSLTGDHRILTPVLQIGNMKENGPAVMFNLYSQQYREDAIDYMYNCSADGSKNCTAITDVIHLVQDVKFSPAVLIVRILFLIECLSNNYSPSSLCATPFSWQCIVAIPRISLDLNECMIM